MSDHSTSKEVVAINVSDGLIVRPTVVRSARAFQCALCAAAIAAHPTIDLDSLHPVVQKIVRSQRKRSKTLMRESL